MNAYSSGHPSPNAHGRDEHAQGTEAQGFQGTGFSSLDIPQQLDTTPKAATSPVEEPTATSAAEVGPSAAVAAPAATSNESQLASPSRSPPSLLRPWSNVPLEEIRSRLADFARERDWEQYHTPRNLLLALVGEAGELAELFQWRSEVDAGPGLPGFSERERVAVEEELADVMLYLIRLSDMCGVDAGRAALHKMIKNADKYPADKCVGSSAKYTAYR